MKLDQGKLRLKYGTGTGALTHWHFNTFRVEWADEWRPSGLINFALDARGEPQTLEQGEARFTRKPERSLP